MTQQGVRWTADQVLALAPDAPSRKAGSRLGIAGPWSEAGSSGEGAVWGLCKGSGSKPYQTVVDIAGITGSAGPAYKCSCPSRKFPCKHALGLLLLWTGTDGRVPDAQPPEWAREWLSARRRGAESKQGPAAEPGPPAPADPEAARRRAERRAERVTAGATELEQRLSDLLRGGIAAAEQTGYGLWEETAARMVDAQAPGLAARVRELGAIPSSGPGWPVRMLEECALLHLLDQGWLHRERLPDALAGTVRSRVGLPTPAQGPPVRDNWLVLAQYDTADSKLTTRRIWLHGTGCGRTALLLSYGAAGRAPALSLPVGLALDAELTAHPGVGQLRTDLGEQFAAPAPTAARPPGVSTARATSHYGEALRLDPWLDSWPVTLREVIPTPHADGWQLADAEGGLALPITPSATSRPGLWRLIALSGGAPVTVFGECGHQGFTPLTAWPQGTGEVVPLC
ncbi:SWIM zinc finger family protein [Streptomyces sp. NBC_01381]|uniref:SWIM zinc finger family protein n=1 Tax=Streptomyces sp. NBC_01381 TaxID=2903845 RepID=UPI00224EA222|nr:SWIM zinc finger family protein [Streptomyces sp. NBC_01381]MCX4669347.1 SWIM zinc finger family protein [Streptomyces sp. NBC_01381]